ncbi:putative metaphase-anaphase transition protein (Mlo2) [Aspergillus candidus]|uniref:Putative zinc finger in N-recognin-domain-containing protein n=1 Tax=Aspergillus candidus TaxID=41067 RepID=A0A2I2FJ44_ASPCN|nr:putative zinc finger in N-recognin-domain-containing protein [Aspergillus candidus]PLB40657.1 putative zinc finger in N-recognin-domain-containing protein [Aspergillus candidus]
MSPPENVDPPSGAELLKNGHAGKRRESVGSQTSQTAKEFIESQMQLEHDAREVLPYSFDSCSQPLGPLRQVLFACLTCNPPPATPDAPHTAAGVCYSCSISCHGEHTLVELFSKRDFVCDCGTTRFPPSSPCTLRSDPNTGRKGVHSQEARPGNRYNRNFQNRFCGCGEDYNAQQENGTMFQCLGLGSAETGGCGEDWWHPECLIGLPRDWYKDAKREDVKKEGVEKEDGDKEGEKGSDNDDEDEETPLPPGFPGEDEFETFLCYKCVDANPWLKRYAGTAGFLPPIYKDGDFAKPAQESQSTTEPNISKKRKAEEGGEEDKTSHGGSEPSAKRAKEDTPSEPVPSRSHPEPTTTDPSSTKPKHESLPTSAPSGTFSLFMKEDFREHFCRCRDCYPHLAQHIQLREEEETYEPPLSETGDEADGARSTGTGSLLDRGEAALSNMDRVRAIEGAMVYNHLRDKVKEFLTPFAESGTAVGAEDIKAYFEKLRGDEQPMREAAGQASGGGGPGANNDKDEEDGRREQSG